MPSTVSSGASAMIALGGRRYQVETHLWFVAIPLAALAGTTLIAALRAIPTDL